MEAWLVLASVTDLALLWRMLGGQGWFSFRRPSEEWWAPAHRETCFVKTADRMLYAGDCTVNVCPLLELGSHEWQGHGAVLWVEIAKRDSLDRLARFRPEPSLVVRIGSGARTVALWALSEWLPVPRLERANKRLAYHLRCVQRHGGAGYRMLLPGTVLREDRKRPAVVRVDGGSREVYSWGPIVARLKDPPDADAWRERAA